MAVAGVFFDLSHIVLNESIQYLKISVGLIFGDCWRL